MIDGLTILVVVLALALVLVVAQTRIKISGHFDVEVDKGAAVERRSEAQAH